MFEGVTSIANPYHLGEGPPYSIDRENQDSLANNNHSNYHHAHGQYSSNRKLQ